ncbi:MAG: hypothetical protein M1838_001512 [Thelocarpon superellum]|nr:MAG: hypothetical protein M1838_001512 [Thelocarpon superellum]
MPRAEVGSTKHLNNKLKSKGLQRLRWYCQACERQMRDENGFKCHTQSESHVRQMLIVGEDPRKAINDFSNQFQRDFLQLLRTAHGEKKVNINHFYQEYIANKEHVHMNATKWPSLTEYAKHLGREGICRVEETEKGILVAWIDNSPEALRRQDAIRKKERQDKGDEEREQQLIREQVARARRAAETKGSTAASADEEGPTQGLKRKEGETIKLNFGVKKAAAKDLSPATGGLTGEDDGPRTESQCPEKSDPAALESASDAPTAGGAAIKMTGGKAKNVFATASKKSNPLGVKKGGITKEAPKRPMSEAERIMKEEIERKRARESNHSFASSGGGFKKQKLVSS